MKKREKNEQTKIILYMLRFKKKKNWNVQQNGRLDMILV